MDGTVHSRSTKVYVSSSNCKLIGATGASGPNEGDKHKSFAGNEQLNCQKYFML